MSQSSFVLENVLWHDAAHDLHVENGAVKELVPAGSVASDAKKIDGKGMLLLPALTDVHTHLREPGQEWKEDIASGLTAAAHGGFANIMCMANTSPVNHTAAVTTLMLDKARKAFPDGGPRLFPIGALTMNLAGKDLAPMGELVEAGCKAISNDGQPVENNELFRRALEYAADCGVRVIDHCEDPHMTIGAGINEGVVSSRLGLKGQSTCAEAIQVARDVILSEYLKIPVHLAHISCRESLEIIRNAKERGVQITAETCPHYLTLTEEATAEYDTNAKVNPPLRTQDDVDAMREAVRTGVIDMLATDHAPHAAHEKEHPFMQAPNGITGLDTALPVTMKLVEDGILSIDDLIRLWCTAPAKTFGLPCNTFAPGDPADFILYDPKEFWVVSEETLYSKGKNTPLLGTTMLGRCAALYVGGHSVI